MMRHEFGDRFAVFRDDERRTRAGDLVHQGQALGFKFALFQPRVSPATTVRIVLQPDGDPL
jgi:hypothetical protein